MDWDSQFTFSIEEVNFFTRLHQKATKFPFPVNIKPHPAVGINSNIEYSIQEETAYANSLIPKQYDRRCLVLCHYH